MRHVGCCASRLLDVSLKRLLLLRMMLLCSWSSAGHEVSSLKFANSTRPKAIPRRSETPGGAGEVLPMDSDSLLTGNLQNFSRQRPWRLKEYFGAADVER